MAKNIAGTELKLGGVDSITFIPITDLSKTFSKTDFDTPGDTALILANIIADTTSITQDDATTNAIERETSDDPIYENITLGKYQISMESGDIQADILTALFGFYASTDGVIYAPAKYHETWASLILNFEGEGKLICPKVKLSSKIDASTLKTGMVKGMITGTCYSVPVTGITSGSEGDPAYKTPFFIVPATVTAGV